MQRTRTPEDWKKRRRGTIKGPLTHADSASADAVTMSDVHNHVVETERIGKLHVYVQGDIEMARNGERPVFLTVHDIGKNHSSWVNLAHHPSMVHIKDRAVFIHVDLLGQEDEAEDLAADCKWPTMQQIGEDLVNVLDNLRVKMVIGLGDGAGANIFARFAAMHAPRCLGIVLINPTPTVATFMEKFKERMTNRLGKIQSSSEQYLLQHRFGDQLEDEEVEDEELVKAFEEYKEKLQTAKLNMKNATKYVECFMARDDLTPQLKKITDDALIVVGAKSPYAANSDTFYAGCDKTKTSVIKVDDVSDVLEEAASKFANSLLLFAKGLGWLTSLATPGVERQRSSSQASIGSGGAGTGAGGRRMSMEEYDKPNIRRLSLTGEK